MTRILRWALPGLLVALAAGAASAAGPGEVLQSAFGREVKFTGGVLLAMFMAIFPVGMIAVWISARAMLTRARDLAGKTFVVAFFHRLMFIVAFWCVVLMGLHESIPLPDVAIIFLTSLIPAMLAFRFVISESMGRILVIAGLFCVLDSVLMAIVMAGSLAAFG